MSDVVIAIVGDHRPDDETHSATDASIGHTAAALDLDVEARWVATPSVADDLAVLDGADGIWIAPGSPYRSMRGALDAITHARTDLVPLLGTCGGFQHVVIEVGRHLAGIVDAQHAEYEPDASVLMIDVLACSLVGQTMAVRIEPGSRSREAYGTDHATERYYCRFGINPDFVAPLVAAGLVISGTDQDGEPRIVELADHPFLVATLFVPQTSSTPERPHPLVTAFVAAAAGVDR